MYLCIWVGQMLFNFISCHSENLLDRFRLIKYQSNNTSVIESVTIKIYTIWIILVVLKQIKTSNTHKNLLAGDIYAVSLIHLTLMYKIFE